MTTQSTTRIQTRKQEMARALALLVLGVGVLLLLMGWIFQQSAPDDRYPRIADNDTDITDTPTVRATAPTPASLLPEQEKQNPAPVNSPVLNQQASLQDKPRVETHEPEILLAQQQKPIPEPLPEAPTKQTPDKVASPEKAPVPTDTDTNSNQQIKSANNPVDNPPPEKSGWIYGGQFTDGKWVERGLVIGEELPVNGQNYALNWGANIRPQPPGKDTTLAQTIGYLPQGKTVEILRVKKSGSKGHIWLEIKR